MPAGCRAGLDRENGTGRRRPVADALGNDTTFSGHAHGTIGVRRRLRILPAQNTLRDQPGFEPPHCSYMTISESSFRFFGRLPMAGTPSVIN